MYKSKKKRKRLQNNVLESVQRKPQNSAQWPTLAIVHSLNFTYKFNVKNITEKHREYNTYTHTHFLKLCAVHESMIIN